MWVGKDNREWSEGGGKKEYGKCNMRVEKGRVLERWIR